LRFFGSDSLDGIWAKLVDLLELFKGARVVACGLPIELQQTQNDMNASQIVVVLRCDAVQVQECSAQAVLLRKLNQRHNLRIRAVIETQIYDDLLYLLRLARIFVVVDDVILQNIVRKLPVLESTGHYEGLELVQENVLKLFLLEKQKEVVEQEVAVLDGNAKLDANSYERSVPLFSLGVIQVLQYLRRFLLVFNTDLDLFIVALVLRFLLFLGVGVRTHLRHIIWIHIFQERVVCLLFGDGFSLLAPLVDYFCLSRGLESQATLFVPLVELLSYDHPDEELELSFHGLLSHVLLLRNVLEALDTARIDVDSSGKLLYPVSLGQFLELLETFVPAQLLKPHNRLDTVDHHETIENANLLRVG
jgi:hypothetical protein